VEYTSLYRGKRHYELSNHLGNVQVVISDKRISVCDEYLAVEHFEAEVLSAVDYYPFGSVILDRQWYANNDSSGYSFGFGGQIKDDDVSGVGNSMTAEFWQYDARLGRRWNIDPLFKKYAEYSPYLVFRNNPIAYIDDNGLEGDESEATNNASIPSIQIKIKAPEINSPISMNTISAPVQIRQFDLTGPDKYQELIFLYRAVLYYDETYNVSDVVDLEKLRKSKDWTYVAGIAGQYYSTTDPKKPTILIQDNPQGVPLTLTNNLIIVDMSNLVITYSTDPKTGNRIAKYSSSDGRPLKGQVRINMPVDNPNSATNLNTNGIDIVFDVSDPLQYKLFKTFNKNLGGVAVKVDYSPAPEKK